MRLWMALALSVACPCCAAQPDSRPNADAPEPAAALLRFALARYDHQGLDRFCVVLDQQPLPAEILRRLAGEGLRFAERADHCVDTIRISVAARTANSARLRIGSLLFGGSNRADLSRDSDGWHVVGGP